MRSPWLRVIITAAALVIWFWSQSLIGARALSGQGIGDGLHSVTAGWNEYLLNHPKTADILLMVSSAIIDLLGISLLGLWILRGQLRPFLSLVIVLGLRQIIQGLVALPAPPNLIWRDPGFPSLLVTYGVANDYFFSGHTAIATLGAIELARLKRVWAGVLGSLIVVFEVLTVIALRAHYTMDVFTGLVTALYAAYLADLIAQRFEQKKLQRAG
jgi:hypothetical protein